MTRRRYVGAAAPLPAADDGYRAAVRSHDPYRAAQNYNVVRIGPDVAPVDRPVRLCAIVDRYPPVENAGAEWMLHHLLRDSVRRGHSAVVVTPYTTEYEIEGVQVVHRSEAMAVAHAADVVVGHLMWTRQAVVTAAAAGRPLVYIVHNHRQLQHWRMAPLNASIVAWNSQWIADRLAPGWDGPNVVVRPPVAMADYRLDRDPWRAPYVTLVNTNQEKGGGVFYELARRPPARRFLAVEGAYGNQMRPGDDTPNVVWQPQTGSIRDDVYAHTRVLLMPSQYESWGRVAIEAMASGVPVVATPTDGLRESLGDAALFCPVDDIDQWSAALAELDNETTYRMWSSRAKMRAAILDRQTRDDLDTWDTTVRRAATAVPNPSEVAG